MRYLRALNNTFGAVHQIIKVGWQLARDLWHTWESDPGYARGGPTYRAVPLRTANRRCAVI
jgi:hypothetical protein